MIIFSSKNSSKSLKGIKQELSFSASKVSELLGWGYNPKLDWFLWFVARCGVSAALISSYFLSKLWRCTCTCKNGNLCGSAKFWFGVEFSNFLSRIFLHKSGIKMNGTFIIRSVLFLVTKNLNLIYRGCTLVVRFLSENKLPDKYQSSPDFSRKGRILAEN